MKRTHVALWMILISLPFLLAGCKGKDGASSNSSSTSPAVAANANSPVTSFAQSATTPAAQPPKLIGTYEWREVEDKGVVTIITKVRTVFVFTADGTYSRASTLNTKTYHRDSGQFRIEGDKLILTIQISEKNIKSPPLIKSHKFSLSSDGDELKMTSDKGSIATYQRTAKP